MNPEPHLDKEQVAVYNPLIRSSSSARDDLLMRLQRIVEVGEREGGPDVLHRPVVRLPGTYSPMLLRIMPTACISQWLPRGLNVIHVIECIVIAAAALPATQSNLGT